MGTFLKIDDATFLTLPQEHLADEIFETVHQQRAYLRQWLPWVDGTKSVEDTLKFIRESIEKNASGEKLTTFIYHKNQFAGSIGFVNLSKEKQAGEIGYWLHQDLQSHGIMTKTCQRFIDYAFGTKAINRIEIKTATGNFKSQAIPRRLGFVEEGILREGLLMYGQFYDLNLFSMLRKEWKDKKSA